MRSIKYHIATVKITERVLNDSPLKLMGLWVRLIQFFIWFSRIGNENSRFHFTQECYSLAFVVVNSSELNQLKNKWCSFKFIITYRIMIGCLTIVMFIYLFIFTKEGMSISSTSHWYSLQFFHMKWNIWFQITFSFQNDFLLCI